EGKFLMGSPGTEVQRSEGEEQHARTIAHPFAMATRKVTVESFKQFKDDMRKSGRMAGRFHKYNVERSPHEDGPIISVTWFEAVQYCRWLSELEKVPPEQMCYPPLEAIKEGMTLPPDYLSRTGYRLPTETEWEYASRAGALTSRSYGSDDELLAQYAWYHKNAGGKARPVGQLMPNAFGLFDTLGNTWDWCQDQWSPYPIKDADALLLPIKKDEPRILRG